MAASIDRALSDDGVEEEDEIVTTMHVDLAIGDLGLVLNEEGVAGGAWRHMAEFTAHGIGVVVDMRSNSTMSASGKVCCLHLCPVRSHLPL